MKFYLSLKNIPEIKSKQDRYTTADNKEKAIHNFAVQIAQKRYTKNMWAAKLNDVKKDISSYVSPIKERIESIKDRKNGNDYLHYKNIMKKLIKEEIYNIKENKMKKSELRQIIKEEIKNILKEDNKTYTESDIKILPKNKLQTKDGKYYSEQDRQHYSYWYDNNDTLLGYTSRDYFFFDKKDLSQALNVLNKNL